MYRFEITAETAEDLKIKVLKLAEEFGHFESVIKTEEIADKLMKPNPVLDQLVFKQVEAPVKQVEVSSELDSKGIPFDTRIHASTKTKTVSGEWKRKRGVSDETAKEIEKQLKDELHKEDVVIPPPPVATVQVPPMNVELLQPVVAPPTPAQPQVEVVKDVTIPEAPTMFYNFSNFLSSFAMIIAELLNTGKIDQAWIANISTRYGVTYLYQITSDVVKAKAVYDEMVSQGLLTARAEI